MSYLFKKGDVVRYKKEEAYNMPFNGHGKPDAQKKFVVEDIDYDPNLTCGPELAFIKFKGDKGGAGCLSYRLELVKEAPKSQQFCFLISPAQIHLTKQIIRSLQSSAY